MTKKQSFDQLLSNYENYLKNSTNKAERTITNQLSRLKSINRDNQGQTPVWLSDAMKYDKPLEQLLETFDNHFINDITPSKPNKRSALSSLGKFVFRNINAFVDLNSIKDFDLIACELVAQSAIFCSKKIFEAVQNGECGSKDNLDKKGNPEGAWYHYTYQRAQNKIDIGKEVPVIINTQQYQVKLDSNNKANQAIKRAILYDLKEKYGKLYQHTENIRVFKDFEACHIWPKTCYNAQYHTSIANVVLLPRPLASLTDHCEAVRAILKYRAWELFRFKPADESEPEKPKYYDRLEKLWR